MPVGRVTRQLGVEVAGDCTPVQPGLISSANWQGCRRRLGRAQAQPVVKSHERPELGSRVSPWVTAGVG